MLRGKGQLPQTPDDAVNRLFQAAQCGDVPAYLATLAPTLRSSFKFDTIALAAEAFAAGLRESVAGMKGLAVSRVGEPSPDRAELDVELVFPDRNQRQRFACCGRAAVGRLPESTRPKRSNHPSPTMPAFDTGGSD